MMQYRRLGRSNLKASVIGFGAWGIGGVTPGASSYGPTEDKTSLHALEVALEQGINFFDTSNAYGEGHSETLLGRAFKSKRHQAIIATKAGLMAYGSPLDFSPQAIRKSLEGSLKRLQSDYVDLLQLHNPATDFLKKDHTILPLVEQLKKEGKIRAFGLSLRTPLDGKIAIERMKPDTLQVNFNLLDQRAQDCQLLDLAVEEQTSIIARTPLCFGFLGGALNEESVFDSSDHRSRWPKSQIKAWAEGALEMKSCMDEKKQTAFQFALRYCISFPAIATTIPGMLTPKEVFENSHANTLGPLKSKALQCVRDVYKKREEHLAESGKKNEQDPGKID
ncbi:aldo/keto reductase [Magnetococcales bacterium HHB-1]